MSTSSVSSASQNVSSAPQVAVFNKQRKQEESISKQLIAAADPNNSQVTGKGQRLSVKA